MAKKGFRSAAENFIDSAIPEPAQVNDQEGFKIPAGYQLIPVYKNVRMQILVSEERKKQIKDAADAQGLSMNELINLALKFYFERKGTE